MKRLLSAPAFQFKGSGWYVTDYARSADSSKKPVDSKESGSSKSEEPKKNSTGDSGSKGSKKDSD